MKFFKLLLKAFIATLGAMDLVVSIFVPFAVVILWVVNFGSTNIGTVVLLIIAIGSAIFRAIKPLLN